MNIKELFKSMNALEETRSINNTVIIDALHDGLEKAFRKHTNCPDALVRVEVINNKDIIVWQQKKVVEDVVDDEIEISVDEAREIKSDAQLDDVIENRINIAEFSRASVTVFKNILTQKIREATKQVIYDEYIDKIGDMVIGTVATVEEKFVLVDLGKALALMLKSEQIPNEIYKEGSRIKVVIKDVNKESKGAQVLVSRASANLVKRLFESSVSEIFEGIVEIKAIAREAGERTKMAVYSKNSNVDAIGACIGQRGQRVVNVIEEITSQCKNSHENIDIVDWNKDFIEYVKNVMKPANVLAVIPDENESRNVLIVVEDAQLSLAIGKRGINARLAGKLLDRNINIKTQSDVEAMGIDWRSAMEQYRAKEQARLNAEEAFRLAEEAEKLAAEKAAEEERVKAERAALSIPVEPDFDRDEDEDIVIEETVVDVQPIVEEKQVKEPEEDEKVEEVVKKRKPKLVKASEYVSKFEELADAKKSEQNATSAKKRKKNDDDAEDKLVKEKLEQLKKQEYEIKPEYSEEEIAEFENADDDHWYDDDNVDVEDYDEYANMYEEK